MLAISQKVAADVGGRAHARQLLRRGERQAGRRPQGGRGRCDGGLKRRGATSKLLAGVELGGTKCVCILGTGPDDVRAVERLPTGEREETLRQIEAVLERWRQQHGPRAPSGSPRSVRSTCARIRPPTASSPRRPSRAGATPTSRCGSAAASACPVGFDTDVNGAALAEGRWGAARGPRRLRVRDRGHRHRRRHHRARPVDLRHESHRARTHSRGAHAGRHVSPASVPFTAIASKAWRRVRPSKRAPACRPRNFRPITRRGISWRTDWANSCTPWCSPPRRAHFSRRRCHERAGASLRAHPAGTEAQPQWLRRGAGARAGTRRSSSCHRASARWPVRWARWRSRPMPGTRRPRSRRRPSTAASR